MFFIVSQILLLFIFVITIIKIKQNSSQILKKFAIIVVSEGISVCAEDADNPSICTTAIDSERSRTKCGQVSGTLHDLRRAQLETRVDVHIRQER